MFVDLYFILLLDAIDSFTETDYTVASGTGTAIVDMALTASVPESAVAGDTLFTLPG